MGLVLAGALVTTLAAGTVSSAILTHNAKADPSLTFSEPSFLQSPQTGQSINYIVSADLGNGHQDIVEATNNGDGQLFVFWNDGNGHYTEQTIGNIGIQAMTVAVGDFNRDGNPDIAVGGDATSGGAPEIGILYGQGLGSETALEQFALPTTASTFGIDSKPTSMTVGNFNGYPDLATVVSYGESGAVDVLLNDGSGHFSKSQLSYKNSNGAQANDPYGNPALQTIAAGDLTGYADGLQSIVTSDANGNVSVFLNTDDPTNGVTSLFANGDTVYSLPSSARAFAVTLAHLNGGNNQLDIVVSSTGEESGPLDANVSVLYNAGQGAQFVQGTTHTVGTHGEDVYLSTADYNNDGYTDVAASAAIPPGAGGTSATPFVSVLPGILDTQPTNSTFGDVVLDTNASVTLQGQATVDSTPVSLLGPVVSGDFGGNSLPDIAAATTSTSSPEYPVGIFTNSSPAPTPGPTVSSSVSGSETIDGTTYITSSSVITLSADNVSAIAYRYYEDSLGTPTTFEGTSAPSLARVGGSFDGIPHNLSSFYLPYTIKPCPTGTTCTTTTTITGTTSGTPPTVLAPTRLIGASQRHVANTTEVSTAQTQQQNTCTAFTLQFYATGLNGNGSPATATTLHLQRCSVLPSTSTPTTGPTTGRSGSGSTSSPQTAAGNGPGAPSGSSGVASTGSAANTASGATMQQAPVASQQSATTSSESSKPTLILIILTMLVLFALGSSLAFVYVRRHRA